MATNIARAILINPEANESLIRQGTCTRVAPSSSSQRNGLSHCEGWLNFVWAISPMPWNGRNSFPRPVTASVSSGRFACVRWRQEKLPRPGRRQKAHLERAETLYGLTSLFKLESPFNNDVFEWLLINEARTQLLDQSRSEADLKARVIAVQKAIMAKYPEDTHHRSQLCVIHLWFNDDQAHLEQCRECWMTAETGTNPEHYDRAAKALPHT